jgi:hypothetical protein
MIVSSASSHRSSRLVFGRFPIGLRGAAGATILFANPSVRDFYPRFGFRRLVQTGFIGHFDLHHVGTLAPSLDLASPTDRAWLAGHCARAGAIGQRFAARDYYPTLLFHLTRKPRTVFRLESFGAVVIAQQDGSRRPIEDLLATRPFSLTDALRHVCAGPVRTIESAFHPEAWRPKQRAEPLTMTDRRSLCGRGGGGQGACPVPGPGADVVHI